LSGLSDWWYETIIRFVFPTPTNATRSFPIHIHYQALLDRAPGLGQQDIRLDAAAMMRVAVGLL
jgi:hypothetical protein